MRLRYFYNQSFKLIIHHPDIETWGGPNPEEAAQFLAGMTLKQRTMLKQIAEAIVVPDERKLH